MHVCTCTNVYVTHVDVHASVYLCVCVCSHNNHSLEMKLYLQCSNFQLLYKAFAVNIMDWYDLSNKAGPKWLLEDIRQHFIMYIAIQYVRGGIFKIYASLARQNTSA